MRHIDDDLLLMILEGQTAPRVLLQLMYDHLRDLCPECRTNLELVSSEMGWSLDATTPAEPAPVPPRGRTAVPSTESGEPAYAGAFDAASRAALRCAGNVEEERRRARRDLAELLALAPTERRHRVAAARSPFRSRALAELLLEECRASVRRDPEGVLHLAELVPLLLDGMPGAAGQPWGEELQARALAHRGNALRVGGDLAAADGAFLALHRFLDRHALLLDDLHPEVASLEASLRDEQGRFQDAVELLDVAVKLAQVMGDDSELARFLVQRGDVHRYNGSLDEARRDLRQALARLDPEVDSYVYLCAVGNYGLYLCEAGEHEEAGRLLERHETLLRRHGDAWVKLRTLALRGYIAHGRGDAEAAERYYLDARDGFAAEGLPFRAALLSLELARLYLEQERHRDLAALARWMGTVFDSHELPNQTTVALMLFQQAVTAQQITLEALDGLRVCLEQAQVAARRAGARPS
jgi:tetratricopeptide (TPR) repeat protein